MPIYWEQNGGGLQEKDSNMEIEDEDCVPHKPQMRSNDEKEWMEDLEVKPILTSKLQTKDKSWDNNYRSNELMFHNAMDYEVQKE